MQLNSIKTLNEIKLSKQNYRHKLRFASDKIKLEANGVVSDSKHIASIGLLKFGTGYLSGIIQKKLIHYFTK
ncbi:MAG: hypothetical protein RBS07_17585 [Lentimicrobium sp.]|jgi:hypothetical protein|nr:hypothetical protein [Lentimicrobium sp.]